MNETTKEVDEKVTNKARRSKKIKRKEQKESTENKRNYRRNEQVKINKKKHHRNAGKSNKLC